MNTGAALHTLPLLEIDGYINVAQHQQRELDVSLVAQVIYGINGLREESKEFCASQCPGANH